MTSILARLRQAMGMLVFLDAAVGFHIVSKEFASDNGLILPFRHAPQSSHQYPVQRFNGYHNPRSRRVEQQVASYGHGAAALCRSAAASTSSEIYGFHDDDVDEKEFFSTDMGIREKLMEDLSALAYRTQRGFNATQSERQQARTLVYELAKYNPTKEPAAAYYQENARFNASGRSANSSLAGKWTLVYTDAPDIIALDSSNNKLAVLGRIGQECEPPYIRNIIEWRRPSWADFLPLAGTRNSRVLQKVVTQAQASPDSPSIVLLKLVGLQVMTPDKDNDDDDDGSNKSTTNWMERIQTRGILPTLLERAPINLQGSLQAPFGEFEILYLDDQLRIIRTGQNYLAVNRRIQPSDDAWF
ncbi:hypothetical protein ACA910_021079 [Epithemia clementina (nom. ined.)]